MIYQAGTERTPLPEKLSGIRFVSRPDAIAEKLRQAIMAGALKPGDRLIERKLAGRFGVGQPTVREGLRVLELQGFVRKRSTKGTYVTHLTPEDFRKILEVRLALEALAIERAAVRLTDAAAADLLRCVRHMEHAARKFNLTAFHQNDLAFHRKIWSLADNEYLGIALERIAFGLFAFVLLERQPEAANEFVDASEQHQRILEGLKTRDPALAHQAFVDSTLWFWGKHHRVSIEARSRHLDLREVQHGPAAAGPLTPERQGSG